FSAELFWLRSAAIQHAATEHRDYQLLERDFAAVGGDPGAMAVTPANIGSAALSAFVFYRAGLPDPVDLLGAMFVIEGLGKLKAAGWAAAVPSAGRPLLSAASWCGEPAAQDGCGRDDEAWPPADVVAAWRVRPRKTV